MNRREFIQSGVGTFFIASADRLLGAGAPSNRVRLAIVGCHAKGRGIAVMRSAMKVPGVEIACVCDVDARARAFAAAEVLKKTGVKPREEKDLRKVLEDRTIDGILSETPDHFHAYSAVMAMKAGKAVYVEKPCCFCPAEGQILRRVAKETGMVLQVGSQRRSSLTYRAAIDWAKQTNALGELTRAKAWYANNRASIGTGRKVAVPEWLDWDLWQGPAPRTEFRDNIVHYNWHWFRRWGTSEMGNNAPHFADISRWALGLDEFPVTVTCKGGLLEPKGGDFEWPDTFDAKFVYANGKEIDFDLKCHTPNLKPYRNVGTGTVVSGAKGSIFFAPNDVARAFDTNGKCIKVWNSHSISVKQTTSTTNPTASLDVRHLDNFVTCLRAKNPKTNADAEQGVKSSVLPLLANISLDCGEALKLDPVTGALKSKAGANAWAREYEKGWELI